MPRRDETYLSKGPMKPAIGYESCFEESNFVTEYITKASSATTGCWRAATAQYSICLIFG